MPFENKIRLPIHANRPQYPAEEEVYTKANGQRVVLNATISKELQVATEWMPALWHERLGIALRHDFVHIESREFTGNFRMSGGYEIEWPDVPYPTAPAKFKGFEDGFAARSSRCNVCRDDLNLSLVDDDVEATEGQTVEVDVAGNDFIGCDTPVFEIASFNSEYLESATISAAGILTVVLKDTVPTTTAVLLATYKVTCDGTSATANVIGAVTGTGVPPCPKPANLTHTINSGASVPVEVVLNWDDPEPPPTKYFYAIEKVSDGQRAADGYTTDDSATIPGLAYSTEYRARVYGACQENEGTPDETEVRYSAPLTMTFTTPPVPSAGLPRESRSVVVALADATGPVKVTASITDPVVDAIYVAGNLLRLTAPRESRAFSVLIPAGELTGESAVIFNGTDRDAYIPTNVSMHPASSRALNENKIYDLSITTV